ncbi:uncharacterized protein N7479_007459 [Penicillium vulpinum]|uniref:uncharacterized protein n=1 Tax=Penicillium vulpinum TaxID=29845 RepID=UPI0025466F0A|nr:uncharacterized protein N7479_007459 [Penicillium vulpinum]KAJ5960309.1 hypothetical protein N7479_007459 [Penicillium vulpinum]
MSVFLLSGDFAAIGVHSRGDPLIDTSFTSLPIYSTLMGEGVSSFRVKGFALLLGSFSTPLAQGSRAQNPMIR